MDNVQSMLRYVFETNNRVTIPISGTGSAGMESTVANLLEPEEEALICINGYFGERMSDMVSRLGARPVRVECEWGKTIDLDKVRTAFKKSSARVIFAVQAETSTGVLHPLAPLRDIADERDGLLLVDAVTSLRAHSVGIDRTGIDACYSGTQKALSCPPGLSPVTFSDRAVEKIRARKVACSSWYLDLSFVELLGQRARISPHAPISMVYALHEALRIVAEEGLEVRARRARAGTTAHSSRVLREWASRCRLLSLTGFGH
jgi:alanine-glyoxylate transaminase/serine-glyoxylate transaminase/serine-pyruvate transaminase